MADQSESDRGEGQAISRYGWYALTLVSAAQAMSLLDRQIMSILAADIRADLNIGNAEIGLLYGTVFALFYALFSLPLGRLVDGWIRTRLLAICLTMWSFFAGLSAFAGGFALLAISRLGVGIGEGATQPAANSIIFDVLPKSRRGLGMAGLGVGLALGLGLSMALGGIVAQEWNQAYPAGTAPGGFSGWQIAFLIAALPGFPLAWLIWRLQEPVRGGMDGIVAPEDPHPFKASANLLGSVVPGTNWYYLWRRDAGRAQWLTNVAGLLVILGSAYALVRWAQGFSPRPPLEVWGMQLDAHWMQWGVIAFGAFVVLNLFQSFKLTDKPAYHVILSPSLILLMLVGGQLRAGPLSDVLTRYMGGKGMVWLMLASLSASPFFGVWAYSAETVGEFYFRFSIYSIILTLWLPPAYALMLGLVLPRMRGITFSTYMIIQTLLGLGIGPYLVGIVADKNGGDLAGAIKWVNVVVPFIVLLLVVVLVRYRRDEASILDRARRGGEEI